MTHRLFFIFESKERQRSPNPAYFTAPGTGAATTLPLPEPYLL